MAKTIRWILVVIMLFFGIAGIKTGMKTGVQILYPLAYEEHITKYANEYGLDKFLIMAVIRTESDFVPDAHSGMAGGLMQLTEETAAWNAERIGIEVYDYMDPETNIMLGCHYLRYLIDHYGVIDTALAAYNGGMGNVYSWLSDERYSIDGKSLVEIPFTETKNYVIRVNEAWTYYRENYEEIRAANLQLQSQ